MKKILSLFGWIFLLLGVTLIGIGSLAYWRTSQLQANQGGECYCQDHRYRYLSRER